MYNLLYNLTNDALFFKSTQKQVVKGKLTDKDLTEFDAIIESIAKANNIKYRKCTVQDGIGNIVYTKKIKPEKKTKVVP